MTQLFIRSELFSQHGWHGVFSKRQGGISPIPFDSLNLGFGLGDAEQHVWQNQKILMHQLGLDGFPHQAQQKHADKVLYCAGDGQLHDLEADILLADRSCALAVRTADCVPILLVDPVTGIFSAVHAGWRGTVLKVVQKAVSQMLKRGAQVQHILASIGPCIGFCCFQTHKDVAEQLIQASHGNKKMVQHDHDAFWRVDLSAVNQAQLQAIGILHQHIEKQSHCTMCDAQNFFSYRRDGAETGRLLAIVAAKKL